LRHFCFSTVDVFVVKQLSLYLQVFLWTFQSVVWQLRLQYLTSLHLEHWRSLPDFPHLRQTSGADSRLSPTVVVESVTDWAPTAPDPNPLDFKTSWSISCARARPWAAAAFKRWTARLMSAGPPWPFIIAK
jgi:hypothetical protein